MRLSYNSFVGNVPNGLEQLKRLTLLHLHSNRLVGSISLSFLSANVSSFVSDCGLPSSFEDPILCESCSMCCNREDACFSMNSIAIEGHFEDYTQLSWVYFLCIVGGFVIWLFVRLVYKRLKDRHESNILVPASQDPQAIAAIIKKEKRRAANIIGKDSVYKYFIEDGLRAWIISFASVGIQLWMCFVFITGSEYDFRKDTSDLVYTWQCPRDQVDCTDSDGRVKCLSSCASATCVCIAD